jgi:hypothetical protein
MLGKILQMTLEEKQIINSSGFLKGYRSPRRTGGEGYASYRFEKM